MSYRKKSIIAAIVFLIATYLLATGNPILNKPMFPAIPLPWGNWITWVGFIAFPLSIFFGFSAIRTPKTRVMGILHIMLKLNLFLAFLWLPISYFLAGNINNSFSGNAEGFQGSAQASQIFWGYNAFLVILPLAILSAVGIQTVIDAIKLKK